MTHINGYMPMRNDDYRHEIEHWAHYLPPASLSKIQWSACALTTGIVVATLARPLMKVHHFGFTTIAGTNMSPTEKWAKGLPMAIRMNWFGRTTLDSGSILGHACSMGAILLTNKFLEKNIEYQLGDFVYEQFNKPYFPYKLWVVPQLSGFLSGAATGLLVALCKHPYDSLKATSKVPGPHGEFKGPMSVLRFAIMEKPAVLKTLFRGFLPTLLGCTIGYSFMFGTFRFYEEIWINWLKQNTLYIIIFVGWCSGVFFEWARYPWKFMHQELAQASKKSHGVFQAQNYIHLLMKYRKQKGMSMCYEGFCGSKPYSRSWVHAGMLVGFSFTTRQYSLIVNGDGKKGDRE